MGAVFRGGGHGKLGIKGKPTKRKIQAAKKKATSSKDAPTPQSKKKQAAKKSDSDLTSQKQQATNTKKTSPSDIVKNGPDNPTDFRSYLLKELHGEKTITMEQAEAADKLFKANRKAAKKKQPQKKSNNQRVPPDLSKESSGILRRTLELLKESFNIATGTSKKDLKNAIAEVEAELKVRKSDSVTNVTGLVSVDIIKTMVLRGGATSGNWGHVGRPGKHGGSVSGGGHKALPFSGKPTRGKIKAASKKVRKQRTEKRAFEKAKETLLSGRGLENLSRAELMTLSSRLDSMLGKSSTENAKLAKEQPGTKKGAATIALGATPDKRYNMQYEVVELSDLVTSNTSGGGINPAYPKELQPRDRTRAASRAQIGKIASNLEPDALLGEFSSIDRGTPILGTDDNAVESGNGRTMALQRAKDSHPDQWAKYQNRLRETAQDRGIDPATLDGYENPVLIRRRTDKNIDRVQFAKDANTAQILGESASERARNDASRITSESLQNIDVRGDINTTITAPTNRAFVRNFVANTPETERAALMTSDGSLTKVGRDRIKGAMFNRVYDAPELSEKIFEALDDDTKNVTNGLMNSLGSMSKAQELVRTGQRAKDLDIAPDIITAVSTFDKLKSSGQTVDNFLAQGSMFGSPVDKNQEKILREIDKRRRSGKKMQEFFEAWPGLVEKEPHPQQQGLFGGSGRSKSQLVDDWITVANRSDQQSLFSMKANFETNVVGLVSVESIKAIKRAMI
jgi:hypothetical protein